MSVSAEETSNCMLSLSNKDIMFKMQRLAIPYWSHWFYTFKFKPFRGHQILRCCHCLFQDPCCCDHLPSRVELRNPLKTSLNYQIATTSLGHLYPLEFTRTLHATTFEEQYSTCTHRNTGFSFVIKQKYNRHLATTLIYLC